MKKLTKKEKLKVWRAVRRNVKEVLSNRNSGLAGRGLCDFLYKNLTAVSREYNDLCSRIMQNVFPEGMKYRPENYGMYWWPRDRSGYESRLEVCNKMIKELEYKK